MDKKIYSSPTLTVYGDLKQITQAAKDGAFTDAAFIAGSIPTFCSSGCP